MRLRLAVLLVPLLFCVACMNPPDKEMNQARGAIEAARAAGADVYAVEDYQAAVNALKRSEDAVAQRDYRQALNLALDSRERAQTAARVAADQKAAVRSQAEHELHDLQALVDEATAKVKATETPRPRRRGAPAEPKALQSAKASVQKARAALLRQDYYGAREAMKGAIDTLRAAMREIGQPAPAGPARRRR